VKKRILLILFTVLFITGCSTINVNSIDNVVDNVLTEKNKLSNISFSGYSYYVPNTLKVTYKNDYNTILSDEYGNKYFVYVDAVGYFNKSENTYKEDKDSYYSKKIVSKDKKKNGYLEINEINKKYFVEAVYNYGKIEVYTSKEHINTTVLNISEVLSSLKYNKKVLESLIGDNVLSYKEESFNIFTTKKTTSNYLDYIEQYDKTEDDDSSLPDNDRIDIGSND
jgi:PBP1b-binding outer membrane lipoprotein LpoB